MKIILQEVHIKNLHNNISKKYRKELTLDMLTQLNTVDPTADIRRKEVAGNFLLWIVRDYYDRVQRKNISLIDYPTSDFARDIYAILNKYRTFKYKGYVQYNDIMKYNYDSLVHDVLRIEREYGEVVYNRAVKGKDYNVLVDNSNYTVYDILTPEGSMYLGKHTKWCISKDDSFVLDVREYIKQKYRVIFILSKRENNSAKNNNGKTMFPNSNELYGIILTKKKEYDQLVDSNNESLFYTSKFNFVNDILLNHKIV